MAYENLDSKLVNALLNDGRASLRSLAEELDVSVTTISNHLSALEESGAITGYTPKVNYETLGYDVTAVLHLSVEGSALEEVTEQLRGEERMISVYEVTGDDDVVAIGKFRDTDEMNDQIKRLVSDANVKGSNTSVVLSAPVENRQFELEIDE
jgi:DNA-binding Lrp family transcriptional regulator